MQFELELVSLLDEILSELKELNGKPSVVTNNLYANTSTGSATALTWDPDLPVAQASPLPETVASPAWHTEEVQLPAEPDEF